MNTAKNQGAPGPIFEGLLALDPRYLSTLDASGFRSSRSAYDPGREGSAPLPYSRANGVGVIDIDGPLLERASWDWWGCCDGHENIAARCLAAAADPSVRVGALRINSPGGVVAGCFDSVRLVRAAFAAAGKPLLVWAGGYGAYSAGYAWACAGTRIFTPDTGGVGSIGVLSTMGDRVVANELAGFKRVVIRSGDRKCEGHPDLPLTDAAIGREQVVVDDMAALFADLCAAARATSPAALLAYQGECFYGATAVQKGLADGVMPWEQFLSLCETEAKTIMTKNITGRLGLAESATEQQIIEAIDSKLAASAALTATATARGDQLAADYVDAQLETAHREGRITASEKEAGAAGGLREMGTKDPAWLRSHISQRKPLSALPKESKESKDSPDRRGASLDGMPSAELAAKYQAMNDTERAALATSEPAKWTAMRAAWRLTNNKGAGAPAQS